MTYFQRVSELTPTRFWINNVTHEHVKLAIEAGAVGCTQNPSYTQKMLVDEKEKEIAFKKMDAIIRTEPDDNEVQVKLQCELVGEIAEFFMPMFEESCGTKGFVSIQGDPFKEDVEHIVKYAEYNSSASPNIIAKIPATEEGLKAIEYVASKGIGINATEVMSVKQALDVHAAYLKATKGMKNPPPIYISHITGILDQYLQKTVKAQNIDVSEDVLWQAGIACAKKTYQMLKEMRSPVGFIGGGARGLHHFTEMVGADANITINWVGTADKLIEQNPPVVQRFLMPVPYSVIDELTEKVPDFVKAFYVNAIKPEEYEGFGPVVLFRSSFETSWTTALGIIKNRRAELGA